METKKKFEIKRLLTATNIIMIILVIFYLLDCYLSLPEGYTGYTPLSDDMPPAMRYIFGNCGGLLTNYLGHGVILDPSGTQIYRRITQMFMHGGLLHLIANLVGLYFIGNYAEKRFGWWLAYIIYFIVGFCETYITDSIYIAISTPEQVELFNSTPSCGASGGIFGLMGASLAAIFFDIKSIKKIGKPTLIVSAVYGISVTYIVSFGYSTVCHNVAFVLGLLVGTLIILPFFILKKGKFSPENKTSEPKPKSVEEQMLENNKND